MLLNVLVSFTIRNSTFLPQSEITIPIVTIKQRLFLKTATKRRLFLRTPLSWHYLQSWCILFSVMYKLRLNTSIHGATSRKVAGSIPDGIIGTFHWIHPSGRAMALRSTQTLIEISTTDYLLGVKTAGGYGWQPYHLHVPTVYKFWEPQPSGVLRACPGL
jgi:hypothetical protein